MGSGKGIIKRRRTGLEAYSSTDASMVNEALQELVDENFGEIEILKARGKIAEDSDGYPSTHITLIVAESLHPEDASQKDVDAAELAARNIVSGLDPDLPYEEVEIVSEGNVDENWDDGELANEDDTRYGSHVIEVEELVGIDESEL